MKFAYSLLLSFLLSQVSIAQDLIPYKKGKLWGYCDAQKNVSIEPQYTSADFFREGLAKVKVNGKYGMINTSGEMVVAAEYRLLGTPQMGRILFQKGELYGYLDYEGKEVIPAQFEYAYTFFRKKEITPAKKNGKYGIIDLNGKTVLPFEHPPVGAISKIGLMTIFTKEGNGVMNTKGEVLLEPKYREKEMHVKTKDIRDYQHFMVINRKDGKKTYEILFLDEGMFQHYYLPKLMDYDHFKTNKLLQVNLPNKGGRALVDKFGKIVAKWDNYPFVGKYNDNAVVVGTRKGNNFVYGLINSSGKTILKPKFEEISSFEQGVARYKYKGLYGFVNDQGDIIQKEKKYEGIKKPGFYENGLMKFTPESGVGAGMMTYGGTIVCQPGSGIYYDFTSHGYIRKRDKNQNKVWLLDKTGKEVTEAYDDIWDQRYGFKVKKGGLWGCLDTELKTLVAPQYDKVNYSIALERFEVKSNGLEGLIAKDGTTIIEMKYQDVRTIKGTTNFWVKENYKWKMVDSEGKQLTDQVYSTIKFVGDGYYTVYKSSWGLIDPNGKLVVDLVCRSPIKESKKEGVAWVVSSGSLIYGYIGKDYTLFWEK